MAKAVKHRAIFTALQAAIVSGHHQPGGRLPSEEALCRRWHVSRPTVRRALRDLQHAQLVDIRVGSGCYVRDHPLTRRPTFALLVESLGTTEILDPICAEINRAAHAAGGTVSSAPLPVDGAAAGELARE
ncbi:MAG: winged helix-turn-helix domain-containing protein, partial [Verrucomicrobiales bacterium]|nr:winged helix-turn-helix domain-containing protein [Verrucomicrobiales bacterium]